MMRVRHDARAAAVREGPMRLSETIRACWTLLLCGFLTASCAHDGAKRGGIEFQEAYDAVIADSQGGEKGVPRETESEGIPSDISRALVEGEGMVERAPVDPRFEPFDIAVEEAPCRDFFMSLVEGTPLNMMVHPAIANRPISLSLKNVTAWEAVDSACEIYGFDCEVTPDGFKIFPRRLTTRVFQVDFLSMSRTGRSETTVSSGNRAEATSTNAAGGTSTTSSVSGSNVQTNYGSDFWVELESTLRGFLGLPPLPVPGQTAAVAPVANPLTAPVPVQAAAPAAGSPAPAPPVPGVSPASGATAPASTVVVAAPIEEYASAKSLMINRDTGLVVVRALPDELRDVERFLNRMRSKSRSQVTMEAKILEVELNEGFQFGIDWLAINRSLGSNAFPPLASEPNDGLTFAGRRDSTTEALSWTQGMILSKGVDLAQPFAFAFREHDFIGFLNLLQLQGKVQVLSSPRVATINNQKAVIKVGQDEIFVTDVNVTTNSDTNERTVDPVFTSFFSGVALDVTPQIGDDEWITLHIHPSVNKVSDKNKIITLGGEEQNYPLAYNESREADSIIRVRNGEVAVIGGMMKNELDTKEARVPVLGDLPYLGNLFRHMDQYWRKSELVILIRPVIVEENERWAPEVRERADRVRNLQRPGTLGWSR
ncbi:MAG: secretin N-terminal domain-containing protein [Magnetococcales bacterium]|nr:secretin N-terminal domain-containing protein [Magnetococcales bacterium]